MTDIAHGKLAVAVRTAVVERALLAVGARAGVGIGPGVSGKRNVTVVTSD